MSYQPSETQEEQPSKFRVIMTRISLWSLLIGFVGIFGLLVVAGIRDYKDFTNGSPDTNSDPRQGEVSVSPFLVKYCDGTTMIYEKTAEDSPGDVESISIDVIPDSEECT